MYTVNNPVLSKLELMTLEIVKALVTNDKHYAYGDTTILLDRAENIALALYNRFEENNSGDE
jgi:hypothetical protein